MIELLKQTYQPTRTDKYMPATRANVKEAKAISDIKQAELLIHINDIAQSVGVELRQGEELDAVVLEFTQQLRQQETYEKESYVFQEREVQYENGNLAERGKRLLGKPNIHPSQKYNSPMGYSIPNHNNNGDNMTQMVDVIKESQKANQQTVEIMQKQMQAMIDIITPKEELVSKPKEDTEDTETEKK